MLPLRPFEVQAPAELEGGLVGQADPDLRDEERLALLWAVKEACAKAMGGGIEMALGHVSCEETAKGWHQVRTSDGLEFRARDFLHDGYVIAMCLRTEDVQRQRKGH